MPPKKIKYDAGAVKLSDKVGNHSYDMLHELELKLKEMEKKMAEEMTERVMTSISESVLNMNVMEFLVDQTIDLFGDDAAHETSIPIADSAPQSGRNTATETRHELITPAGHVLTVPSTIHPLSGKPFRRPHLDEEVAFSVNGSPMILGGTVREVTKHKTVVVSHLDKGTAV